MDEKTIKPNANFKAFKAALDGVIAELTNIGRPTELPLAAE